MTEPKKAAATDEVHGYEALDRLESESIDRAQRPAPQHNDSAYDQLWLGEENFYLGQ